MRHIGSRISCLLLALWFVAMLHCSLEAATSSPSEDGDGDRCACCQGAKGADDECTTNEAGAFKPSNETPKLLLPDFVLCTCELCVRVAQPDLFTLAGEVPAHIGKRPQEWVASWTFVRREALSPRAPSLWFA